MRDHLADDLEARGICRASQQAVALVLHALKGIRRGARLIGAAAQKPRARCPDALRGLQHLFLALHRAGPRHHAQLFPADDLAAHRDGAPLRAHLMACQLIGVHDGHTFFHAIHQLQVQALQLRLRAGGKVRPHSAALQHGDDGIYLLPVAGFFHYDNH